MTSTIAEVPPPTVLITDLELTTNYKNTKENRKYLMTLRHAMSPDRKFHRTNDKVSPSKMLRGEKNRKKEKKKNGDRQGDLLIKRATKIPTNGMCRTYLDP